MSYTVPAAVRKAARLGLSLRKKQKRGARSGLTTKQAGKLGIGSGVARARDLIKGKVSLETIRRMSSYFRRHRGNYKLDRGKEPEEDRGYVAGLLWGGEAGRKWAASVLKSQRNPPMPQPLEIYVSQYTDWYPVFAEMILDQVDELQAPSNIDETEEWLDALSRSADDFAVDVEQVASAYVEGQDLQSLEEELFRGQYADAERYLAFKYDETLAELFPALVEYSYVWEMLGELQDEGRKVSEADIIEREIRRGQENHLSRSNPPGERMKRRANKAPTRRRDLPRRNGRARRNAVTKPRGGTVIAAKVNAGNDRSGNPRRGWIIYHAGGYDDFTTTLGFVDEGYSGRSALREQAPGAVEIGAPTFSIPVREYQKFVRMGPPAYPNPLTDAQHLEAGNMARRHERAFTYGAMEAESFGDQRAENYFDALSQQTRGAQLAHEMARKGRQYPERIDYDDRERLKALGVPLEDFGIPWDYENPPPKPDGKWHRIRKTGWGTEWGFHAIHGGYAIAYPWAPRKMMADPQGFGAQAVEHLERQLGKPVPKGTKYIVLSVPSDRDRPVLVAAHKTLDAAKKAGLKALGAANSGAKKNKPAGALLPLASSKKKWSGNAARARLKRFCKLKDGTMSEATLAKAFAHIPAKEDRQKISAYKLPIADVVNGRLVAVPKAIKAADGSLDGARGGVKLNPTQKGKARRVVNAYMAKVERANKGKK